MKKYSALVKKSNLWHSPWTALYKMSDFHPLEHKMLFGLSQIILDHQVLHKLEVCCHQVKRKKSQNSKIFWNSYKFHFRLNADNNTMSSFQLETNRNILQIKYSRIPLYFHTNLFMFRFMACDRETNLEKHVTMRQKKKKVSSCKSSVQCCWEHKVFLY